MEQGYSDTVVLHVNTLSTFVILWILCVFKKRENLYLGNSSLFYSGSHLYYMRPP